MSVEVRAIELPSDAARFCRTWWPIYANDPHWVPPLLFERERFLDPGKNPYFQVGARAAASWPRATGRRSARSRRPSMDAAQEREPGVGFFGFFEFPDDLEPSSRALFETPPAGCADQGMDAMRGPYSLSPNHEFGLRVDGWDTDAAVLNPHNRDYYARHYEALGLVGVRDWYAYWLDHAPVPERLGSRRPALPRAAPASRAAPPGHGAAGTRRSCGSGTSTTTAGSTTGVTSRITHDEFVVARARPEADGRPGADLVGLRRRRAGRRRRRVPRLQPGAEADERPAAAVRAGTTGCSAAGGSTRSASSPSASSSATRGCPSALRCTCRIWEAGLARGWRGADASLVLEDNLRMRGSLEKLGARIYQTYRIYEYRLDGRRSAGDQGRTDRNRQRGDQGRSRSCTKSKSSWLQDSSHS